jgi:hypothetical protein
MSALIPYNYKCPNLDCRAEYVAVRSESAPQRAPRCIECQTPFLAMEEGVHIHYEATWPVVFLPPDQTNDSVLRNLKKDSERL